MRATVLLATSAGTLAIIAACADSEDVVPPEIGAPPATTLDAAAPEDAATETDVPDTSLPKCSAVGWCITDIPDRDLDFTDIWPFEQRAFAIARSRVEGIKVLEWQKTTETWQYIDDKTQNDVGVGTFAGRIYAPSEDEVYFTAGPSFVYHGQRPTAPETRWTWTRQELPDNVVGHPAGDNHGNPEGARAQQITLGVWGTGKDDVYAYYSNTIFRRGADGTWSSVYVADDLTGDEHVFFSGVAGTGPDDIWFVGARQHLWVSCPFIVRKTPDGWTRVADGIVNVTDWPYSCEVQPGTERIGDSGGGWLIEIQQSSPTELLALHSAMNLSGLLDSTRLTRLRLDGGGVTFQQSAVPVKIANASQEKVISSMWRASDETWLTSWGLVLRGTDDGTYATSTLSRDGAPVDAPLRRVRGTSTHNLWAIGARHAYHKTTP